MARKTFDNRENNQKDKREITASYRTENKASRTIKFILKIKQTCLTEN